MERLQEQQIIGLLELDETAQWCNSFAIVPEPNGTACLCMDPAWLNHMLLGWYVEDQQLMAYFQN